MIRVRADRSEIATDPKAHRYDHGRRVFGKTSPGDRGGNEALEAAKRWVAEQGWYDGPWRRNRMRHYVPEAVDKAFPIRRDERRAGA